MASEASLLMRFPCLLCVLLPHNCLFLCHLVGSSTPLFVLSGFLNITGLLSSKPCLSVFLTTFDFLCVRCTGLHYLLSDCRYRVFPAVLLLNFCALLPCFISPCSKLSSSSCPFRLQVFLSNLLLPVASPLAEDCSSNSCFRISSSALSFSLFAASSAT